MASTYISLPASSVTGPVEVILNPLDDAVAISDGVDTLAINPDGSINVNVGGNVINEYGEINNVASSGLYTTILSYVAPSNAKLKLVSASGTNIADYRVTINANVEGRKWTYFSGPLSVDFDFRDGIDILNGDLIVLEVRHSRTDLGDFTGNFIIQI